MTSSDSEQPASPELNSALDAVEAQVEAQAEAASDEWLKELPEEVVAWLVRALPTREMWDWLGEEERGNLRLVLLSGFRATPANLKQRAVMKKLAKHASTHTEILRGLIELWRGHHKPLFEAIQERDDEALGEILPALLHSHGGEALLLALATLERHKALDALASLGADEDEPADAEPHAAEASSEADGNSDGAPLGIESQADDSGEEAARLQTLLDEARERASKLQAGLSAALLRVEKERDRVLQKARESDRAFKALQNRAANLEKERDESRKLLDRSERRQRHAEREKDDLEADNKRLRRQMRRQQEISEEIRKQLARANAQLEELRPAAPASTSTSASTSKPTAPASKPAANGSSTYKAPKLSPLEREYVLRADGRQHSVTARQVKARVDANDEEWVFRLIQALEAVAQVDAQGHKTFLEALKPLGNYYRRVLTADTLRVLVDASNVVRFEKDHLGKGHLKYLLEMRDELRRRDCFPIKLIADASLPHFIDEPDELSAMARRGEVEMAVPGQEADEILAREARRTGAYVVTNDRLFFQKATPDFEPPRITFRIIGGHLIVDEF